MPRGVALGLVKYIAKPFRLKLTGDGFMEMAHSRRKCEHTLRSSASSNRRAL